MTNYAHATISKRQVAGILLMAAGWGWVGGNFVPDNPVYLYNALAHFLPILLLLGLSVHFFRGTPPGNPSGSKASWISIGLTVFAVVSLLSTIVLILVGVSNPDPDAIGVKTLPDWVPTIILITGTVFWLTSLIPAREAEARRAADSQSPQ